MTRHALSLRENSTCLLCPDTTPPCDCEAGEVCISVSRTCDSCASNKCLPQLALGASSTPSRVSVGTVAGAVIASVLVFALALALYLWYRRRWQRRARATRIADEKTDTPARAEDVLRRPDPNTRAAAARGSPDMPAFRFPDSDSSLARDSTSGSHVATHGHSFAPGARYPAFSGAHSDHRLSAGTHPALISATFAPGMVQDAPPLPSTSDLSGRPPGHQPSDRNHDQPNTRNSYNTTTTFSSDLSSIPIVEASHGTVRQVLGVARAAVVRTPKPSLSSIHPSLHIRRLSGTKSTLGVPAERPPPVPSSPLARFDFPRVLEESKEEEDPFRDRTPSPVPSRRAADRRAITQSTGTFGDSGTQRWPPPRARKRGGSAPDNNVVEQGSVSTPTSASPRRSTHNDVAPQMLAPPHSMDVPLTPASARHDMLAVPGEERRRDTTSDASVLSATSSFAESLLSSFPFVPPSPPGSFNARTPPRSPQASRSFNGSGSTDVLAADPVLPRIASSTSSSSSGTHRSSFTGDSTRSPSFPNRRMDGSRLSTDQDFRS